MRMRYWNILRDLIDESNVLSDDMIYDHLRVWVGMNIVWRQIFIIFFDINIIIDFFAIRNMHAFLIYGDIR